MGTTAARRKRRLGLGEAKQRQASIQAKMQSTFKNLRANYKQNPNETLDVCLEVFGSDRFQNSLRIFLHTNSAEFAFMLAAQRCMEQTKA